LDKGEGEKEPLKRNGYFQRRPHHLSVTVTQTLAIPINFLSDDFGGCTKLEKQNCSLPLAQRVNSDACLECPLLE
jgi:hypothetical protein